jgi:D-serine deaminase-like pyridoxal phosphate-dependent protein
MNTSQLPQPWVHSNDQEKMITPQVIVHYNILLANIDRMAHFAKEKQIQLRPHLKTHKTAEIAELQLERGAVGITVAKIGEAEKIVNSFQDQLLSILIAFPTMGRMNMIRIVQLQKKADIILMIDSLEQASELNEFALENQTSFIVMVKINTGLHRCGIEPDEELLVSFVAELLKLKQLLFVGLMTHAGHAYGASSTEERVRIGKYEGETLVKLGHELQQKLGLDHLTISVGSTPTVFISGGINGVTEIRPGNYIFNDKSQVMLGSSTWNDCALRVLSRVVSHPTASRWIIDSGAKTLALDQGAHGKAGVSGYGQVVGHPDLQITRLSEEHGVLEGIPSHPINLGEVLEIIPNHACPVVNLTDQLLVLQEASEENTYTFRTWDVLARGQNA